MYSTASAVRHHCRDRKQMTVPRPTRVGPPEYLLAYGGHAVALRVLTTLQADALICRAHRHVPCPLSAREGASCRSTQLLHDIHRVGDVPQPHRVIVAAAGQGLAVRAERHRADYVGMAGEGLADRAAGGYIPQPDCGIVAAAGQGLAVRAERHRADLAGVAGEGLADRAAGGHAPQPDCVIVAAAG